MFNRKHGRDRIQLLDLSSLSSLHSRISGLMEAQSAPNLPVMMLHLAPGTLVFCVRHLGVQHNEERHPIQAASLALATC